MTSPSLEQAISAVLRRFLEQNKDLALSVAVIAEHLVNAAREVAAAPGVAASTEAVAAAAPGVASPVVGAVGGAVSGPVGGPVGGPVSGAVSGPVVVKRAAEPANSGVKLSSGFVPLKLADNTVTHVRVLGTGDDLAAARFSAQEGSARNESDSDEVRKLQPPDLELIVTRCALKSQACHAAIVRRLAAGTSTEQEEIRKIGALITQGKSLDNCYLWMVNRAKPQPTDEVMRLISHAYDNLGAAARCCLRVPRNSRSDRRAQALNLLAEAQSALRVSLIPTWLTLPDRDQDDAFRYLDDSTTYEQVFIPRFMKLSDPADPGAWESLRDRIESFSKSLELDEESNRQIRTSINKIRHHAKAIAGAPGEDRAHDWQKIESALASLAESGRLREPEIADLLRPIAASAPGGAGYPTLGRVIESMRGGDEVEEAAEERAYSASVQKVRDMLAGSRVVIVGGERREEAVNRIREAFELAEVEWVALPEHGSTAPAEAPIRRADTRLVLVLIRLAGHLHTEEVAMFCDRHGKPLIRLPAGYNPERIAAEVLEQASGKLAGAEK
ncbi:MAG TPA: hypothetical protein VK176_13795 [Phycisphaerales bacterium]|nr:hypothetical protein [Phycisphaerales bacterium]